MDEQDWKALARISSSQDGKRLLAILARQREDCRDKLERLPDTQQINRCQGAAEILRDLIQSLSEAREVVDKRFTKN